MVGSSHESDGVREVLLIVLFAIVVYHLLRLASLICRHVCTSLEPSDHAGRQPAAAVVGMGRPLVCTYLRADGWQDDATCGVCLEDLADGDEVTLLQPCMHCFHAGCGSRWIQLRATCPLCRAPVADDGTVLPQGSSDDVHA